MQRISAWEKDEKRRGIRFAWGIFRLFRHHIELPFILLSQVENRKRGRSCRKVMGGNDKRRKDKSEQRAHSN